jgi:hypothetical protein
LLNSEVAILLEHRQQTAAVQEEGEAELSKYVCPLSFFPSSTVWLLTPHTFCSVFLKTLSYVQRFSRYKTKAAVKEVRRYPPAPSPTCAW